MLKQFLYFLPTTVIMLFSLFLFPTEQVFAQQKTALVLATFGSTYEQKLNPLTIAEKAIKAQYPNLDIFHAYTSAHVMKTLKSRGQNAASLPSVLATLGEQGYKHVAILPLHVTPGEEFYRVQDITQRFNNMPKGIKKTSIGSPLIGSDKSAQELASALFSSLPQERKKNDAVIYIGHGSHAPIGSLAYPALQAYLQQKDPLLFVGVIEGQADVTTVITDLKERGIKKVWLVPLLTVVGDHAHNDIFGDDVKSWKMLIKKEGMEAVPVPQGLAALPTVAAMWVKNAKTALDSLEKESK